MGEVREEILEALEEKEMTATELSRELGRSLSMIYMELYRLEAEKKVKRRWEGAWVWRVVHAKGSKNKL